MNTQNNNPPAHRMMQAERHHRRGVRHYLRGDYHRAVREFGKAIHFNPNYAEAYYNRGNAYHHKDKYDLAISDYDRATELNPKYAEAYCNRGLMYSHTGNYNQALHDFNRALDINPKLNQARASRGVAHALKGNHNHAVTDLNVVVEIWQNHAVLYLCRGKSYHLSTGDEKAALKDFDNAVRLCPNYESDFIDHKFVHAVESNVEYAIGLLDKAIASPPESADDFYYLGIKSLYENDALSARDCFTLAERKGFEDSDKLRQHQENLKSRRLPRS